MKKIVKSPKKQSAKITKLKMRVGEIANMLLQNNPKMVRMRSGGSSGYADLFMSKQLMKGGITDGTQGKIVEFLKEKNNKEAVQALKIKVINDDNANPEIKDELYKELYNYKLCDKYNDVGEGDLKDNLITLDIVNKFYLLVKDKKKDGDNVLTADDIKGYSISNPNQDDAGRPAPAPAPVAGAVDEVPEVNTENVVQDANDILHDAIGIDIDSFLRQKNKYTYNIDTHKLVSASAADDADTKNLSIFNDNLDLLLQYNITKNEDIYKLNSIFNNLFDASNKLKEDTLKIEYDSLKNRLMNIIALLNSAQKKIPSTLTLRVKGGKPPAKYKSTGRIVHIMYKKRNYKRTVYVKDKRNTKYCKIDGEYILLSKMKMIA